MKVTVATPTYNRANTLNRVFESLRSQTFKDFQWIVIDDGSQDDTARLIEELSRLADFDIIYKYQNNSGKHIALNRAVELAQGQFFVIADSDDSFLPESLEVLLKYWDMIDEKEKSQFRGVTCRCYNPETMAPIGKAFPGDFVDMLGLDGFFKAGYGFEMWGMNKTDIMKEFPFPELRKDVQGGLSFFPETVIWNRMGRKYKVRYINHALRAYYKDQENAATSKKRSRSSENMYLWQHYINEVFDYFLYNPRLFIKAATGLSMDGFLIGMKKKEILDRADGLVRKLMVLLFMPLGYLLYKKRKDY